MTLSQFVSALMVGILTAPSLHADVQVGTQGSPGEGSFCKGAVAADAYAGKGKARRQRQCYEFQKLDGVMPRPPEMELNLIHAPTPICGRPGREISLIHPTFLSAQNGHRIEPAESRHHAATD